MSRFRIKPNLMPIGMKYPLKTDCSHMHDDGAVAFVVVVVAFERIYDIPHRFKKCCGGVGSHLFCAASVCPSLFVPFLHQTVLYHTYAHNSIGHEIHHVLLSVCVCFFSPFPFLCSIITTRIM